MIAHEHFLKFPHFQRFVASDLTKVDWVAFLDLLKAAAPTEVSLVTSIGVQVAERNWAGLLTILVTSGQSQLELFEKVMALFHGS